MKRAALRSIPGTDSYWFLRARHGLSLIRYPRLYPAILAFLREAASRTRSLCESRSIFNQVTFAARRENALEWNGSIAPANRIRPRRSIDLHEIGCKKTGEIFSARARRGKAWAKLRGGNTLAAPGSRARNPAWQISRRACRGSLRNWARGHQARQAGGRSRDAGRSLSPSRRLFPARQDIA